MSLIPEWAPNIHPMFVHFPLGLLVMAIAVDAIGLFVRSWDWLRPATDGLYVLGGLSAIATYFTGLWAADAVNVPAEVQHLLTEHANLGWWTMWFFGLYAIVRLFVTYRVPIGREKVVQSILFAVALAGMYLLWETGEHGAQMVYRYGIGVQAVEESQEEAPAALGLTKGEDGWQWRPQTPVAWTEQVQWLGNPSAELKTKLVTAGPQGQKALSLRMEKRAPLMFVIPDTLGSVQVNAALNLDDFEGTVMLVHHVQDDQNFDFLALEGGTMRLGRIQDGETEVFDEGTFEQGGWLDVRAVGDQDHFRGYFGSEMVAHGHGSPLSAGRAGLRLDGTGTVLVRSMGAQALEE